MKDIVDLGCTDICIDVLYELVPIPYIKYKVQYYGSLERKMDEDSICIGIEG